SQDTIPGTDLVKEKATPGTKINAPKSPIKVDNAKALSDADKEKVKQAVEDANKDDSGNSTLPKDATIEVGDDGTVTVKDKDGKVIGTLTPDKTVAQNPSKLGVKAPEEPVAVKDPKHLTDAEKQAVEKAVRDANKDLPKDATVTVAEDGTVTVKSGDKEGTLTPTQTVRAASAPEVKANSDGSVTVVPPQDADKVRVDYTDANGNPRSLTLKKGKGTNGNWILPKDADPSITMNPETGEITITARSLKPGTIVTATAIYPDGGKSSSQVKSVDNRGNNGGSSGGIIGGTWIIPGSTTTPSVEKPKHETAIHKLYIYGYEDNTFRPEGNMTRAEAAAMIARLQGLDLSNKARPGFIDVRSGWYNAVVNAVVNAGYMKGYPDGTFRPNDKITRAEFAQMIKAIDKANTGMAPFADAKGHWAEAAINQAYGNKRITGYPDGTFRPNNNITRAEAVTVFNKLYDRSVGLTGLRDVLTGIVPFNDVNASHWAYYDIIEASNTHTFYRTEKGQVPETWVMLNQTWKQALENR
ncbi:S-layer homology domain-containing protein, partial [Peptoniphilus sp. HCN-40583]|uniref:S-layer homology domain-containing protein n=1 Tax=Peptoniphilus sp. HCN-40583 TaxID=3134662 RepID=UPI0030C21AD2